MSRILLAAWAASIVFGGLANTEGSGLALQQVETRDLTPYQVARHISGKIGSRPASGRGERRAHDFVGRRFAAAGLGVRVNRFPVPGRKRSRNVIGRLETPASCLLVLIAHTDSVPPGLGANDNASGVGVLVGLARRIFGLSRGCDMWLLAPGAE